MKPSTNRTFIIQRTLRPHGKHAFLASLPDRSKVLDIGCGNRSALIVKRINPSFQYVGIDVGDYNQSPEALAATDEYVVASASAFADAIRKFDGQADAVVSAHNLEHCDSPDEVLSAMCAALKTGGRLLLAFPSEASVAFPSRKGTLNFWDDPTHKAVPSFKTVCEKLSATGVNITFSTARYRPPVLFALGALLEPVGALTKRNMPLAASWAYHGFEAIIWGTKKS